MRNSPEDEIIVKNFDPRIDFKKQAIAASIDYYLAAKRVGEYSHYLYDFLLQNKIIQVSRDQILSTFEKQKEKALEKLERDRYWYSEEGYKYQLDQILIGKDQRVINRSKVAILTEIMEADKKTKLIDLKLVKTML